MGLPRTWGRVTCTPSCTSHMGWCPLLWHPELSGSGGNLQVGAGEEMFVEAPSAYWRSHIMPIFRFLFLYPDLSGAAWRMWLWKHVWKKSWYAIRRKGVFCPLFTASCEMLFYPPAKTEVLLNLWQDLKGAEPTPGRLVLLTWDMDCISEPSAGTLKILALNSLQHPLPVRGCNCKAVAIDKMSQTFSQKYLFIFSCFCACWDICDMQNHVTANKHASSQTDKTALGINKLKTSQLVASRAILLAIQYNNMQYFFISLYNSLQKHLLVRYGHDNLSCVEDIRSRKLVFLCSFCACERTLLSAAPTTEWLPVPLCKCTLCDITKGWSELHVSLYPFLKKCNKWNKCSIVGIPPSSETSQRHFAVVRKRLWNEICVKWDGSEITW